MTRVAGPGEVWGWAPLAAFEPAGHDVVVPIGSPRPSVGTCECNGCTTAREGRRKRGGQEVACYAPECRQRLADDEREAKRVASTKARRAAEERHRAGARGLILADPSRSDRDIAAELTETYGETVAMKRVREARESV